MKHKTAVFSAKGNTAVFYFSLFSQPEAASSNA